MGTNGTRPGGEGLREARKARAMSQTDVAVKAGCAVSHVSQVENGYTPRNPASLEQLAVAVGASYGSFWPGA